MVYNEGIPIDNPERDCRGHGSERGNEDVVLLPRVRAGGWPNSLGTAEERDRQAYSYRELGDERGCEQNFSDHLGHHDGAA